MRSEVKHRSVYVRERSALGAPDPLDLWAFDSFSCSTPTADLRRLQSSPAYKSSTLQAQYQSAGVLTYPVLKDTVSFIGLLRL